jgi:hypothetical protein
LPCLCRFRSSGGLACPGSGLRYRCDRDPQRPGQP